MMALATCSARAIPPEAHNVTRSRAPSRTRAAWISRSTSRMWRGFEGASSRPCASNTRWITSAPSRTSSSTRPAVPGVAGRRIATIRSAFSALSDARTSSPSSPSGTITMGAAVNRPSAVCPALSSQGTTFCCPAHGSGERSWLRTTEKSPSSAAARAIAGTTAPRRHRGGTASNMTGIGLSSSGGGSWSSRPSSKASCASLRPMSTLVLMYSRPWMPSRVGRTISDMSVQRESNPGPLKRPP